METFIDNSLIKRIAASKSKENPLLKALIQEGVLTKNQRLQIIFGWPSLLEYLHLGGLFKDFYKFDKQNELFSLIATALIAGINKEDLFRLYDQVFVECLVHVKALPQIDPVFLVNQIQERRHSFLSLVEIELFSRSLERYEKLFIENPSNTMHDLILYLAWDRVCTNFAIVFEEIPSDPKIQFGLDVFKECLLESFQHITAHGRTAPGFFRLLETLYAYQMRQEYLQTYTDSEWLILCQSARALRPREGLNDVFYVDAAVVENHKFTNSHQERDPLMVLTMDSPEKIKDSLDFTLYMIENVKNNFPEWRYTLGSVKIVCLRDFEEGFLVETIVDYKQKGEE